MTRYYPTPSKALVPSCFVGFLNARGFFVEAEAGVRLSAADLDAGAWKRFGEKICVSAAKQIVLLFADALIRRKDVFSHMLLPIPPKGLVLTHAGISSVAYRRLLNAGIVDDILSGKKVAVGRLFCVEKVGVRAILAFLVSLDDAINLQRTNLVATPVCALGPVPTDRVDADDVRERLVSEISRLVVDATGNSRHAEMFMRVKGWDGKPLQSLREIGAFYGVTHERVRQISNTVGFGAMKRVPGRAFPEIERAMSVIGELAPRHAEEISFALSEQGLCDRSFKINGLISAANMICGQSDFKVAQWGGKDVVLKADQSSAVYKIIENELVRQTRKNGLATFRAVYEMANQAIAEPVSHALVLLAIKMATGFEFLDSGCEWIWRSDSQRNRILSRIGKVVFSAKIVSLSEIADGIERDSRVGIRVPENILAEICRRSGYQVDGGMVFGTGKGGGVPSLVESQMFDILNKAGGRIRRNHFAGKCIAAGINPATFYVYLSNSVVFKVSQDGFCSARGAA